MLLSTNLIFRFNHVTIESLMINNKNIMSSATISINTGLKPHKVLIELDAHQFEKLAADFGFFSQDFLASLDRAEEDYKKGRIKKINSLRDLTK